MTGEPMTKPRALADLGAVQDTGELWRRLLEHAHDRDLSGYEIAGRMNYSRHAISTISVRARRGQPPSLRVCVALARMLGLEVHISIRPKSRNGDH